MTERRELINKLAVENPSVGDVWIEMLCFICKVTSVDTEVVAIHRNDGETRMTRDEFKRWLTYDTIPDKTWADCRPAL